MSGAPSGLRALLLDLDNTLIDRRAAFDRWMAPRFPADNMAWLRALDAGGGTPRSEFCAIVARLWPEQGDAETFWAAFRMGIADSVAPDPAVTEALAMLADHYLLAIVSNGGGDNQRRKMARAGITIEPAFISGELGFEKPDPRIFQAALDALGVAPGEAMMVGDDIHRDVYGAAALGLRTCWVAGASKRYAPELGVAHFSELPQSLGIRSKTPPAKAS